MTVYIPTGSVTAASSYGNLSASNTTVTIPNSTATGTVLVSNGTGTTWANSNSAKISAQGKLHINGENADLVIGEKSMVTWMQKVEQRLSILEPKPELLAKYEALQQAYDHYKTLEALLHEDQTKE